MRKQDTHGPRRRVFGFATFGPSEDRVGLKQCPFFVAGGVVDPIEYACLAAESAAREYPGGLAGAEREALAGVHLSEIA